MKVPDALRELAQITAYQWGMVTAAQASSHGVSRLDLSRLTESGHLKRLAHGIYMDSGAPGEQFDDIRAAWLSAEPKRTAEDRLRERELGVIVAGPSAARLHGIGDLREQHHDFVAPVRRQSQRPEIRYRQRALNTQDVTIVHGLPVMTMERTLADLLETVGDLSLVADALRDASRKQGLDWDRLRELLNPLAARNGFKTGDGSALLNRLREIASIDSASVAKRVAMDQHLGMQVAADYFANLSEQAQRASGLSPELLKSIESAHAAVSRYVRLTESLSESMRAAVRPTQELMSSVLDAQRLLTYG